MAHLSCFGAFEVDAKARSVDSSTTVTVNIGSFLYLYEMVLQKKMPAVCGHRSTGYKAGLCKYLCLYSVATLFFSIGYFAVYLPAAEKELEWKIPEGGCTIVAFTGIDYEMSYTPEDQTKVIVTLKRLPRAPLLTVGEVYPRCKYYKHDYSKVDLDPSPPASLPGFIVLMVLGGLSLFVPTCYCFCYPGEFGFQKIVDPVEHRRKFKAIALFGPPGVGKRTILDVARNRGLTTYDVTEMGDSYHERLEAFRKIDRNIRKFRKTDKGAPELFVAADLHRDDIPKTYETVVLKPSFSVYDKRYKQCCQRRPEKNAHNHRQMYNVFQTKNFHRLLAGDISPQAALDLILEPYSVFEPYSVSSSRMDMIESSALAVPLKMEAQEGSA
jgi:hypothetical protein